MPSSRSRAYSPDDLLFTFAVVADSHINPHDDSSSSPWESNRQANDRSRRAVEQINRLAPDFVVHLGDLVHPVPAQDTFDDAAQRFHDIYAGLSCPLHLVPGNHDVGDKPGEWLPAQSVTPPFLETYRSLFGQDRYSFDHGECHFVIINAQLLNSGLPAEEEQRAWLEADLRDHADRRTFVFSHYPPFIASPTEIDHYDNIDEPARSWLLDLVVEHGVEGVFAGHVHNFFYNRLHDGHHYVAPSLAFVRQDYSELFRIAPEVEQEYGRNDTGKLGFFLVEVYPDRHVARIVRDYLGRDAAEVHDATGSLSPAGSSGSRLALDTRQAWTEHSSIPYNGVVDEFARKPVRSDYPLMTLWEMGVDRLRVPLPDLLDDATRARMVELGGAGHRFQVFSYCLPNAAAVPVLREHADLLSGLEVIQPPSRLETQVAELADLGRTTGVDLLLSTARTSAHGSHGGDGYAHYIRHGFTAGEGEMLRELLTRTGLGKAVAGLAFTVSRTEEPTAALATIDTLVGELGLRATALVRLAADHPGAGEHDDLTTAGRVAQAALSAHLLERVDVTLDTFADVDRGYFPRNGLADRRFNLRPAGHVVRNLAAVLPLVVPEPVAIDTDVVDLVTLTRLGDATLVVPHRACRWSDVAAAAGLSAEDDLSVLDLVAGRQVLAPEAMPGLLVGPALLHRSSAISGSAS